MLSAPSLCFVIFVLCNCYSQVGSLNEEGTALLSFKESIKEDPHGVLNDWNSSDKTPCSWSGVGCTCESVASIILPNHGLLGIVPSVLGSLSSLKQIDLSGNSLHGSLPAELFDAPSLKRLVFHGNFLSGSLHPEIGKLVDIHTLDLSNNLFNGTIPASILHCKRLSTLDLRHNNFTGHLPAGFGSSLSMLEVLDLSYNGFSGSIPGDFGNLSSLQGTADLSHNHFSGPIPPSLGKLPEKVYINLSYNNLTGSMPQSGSLLTRGPTAFIGNPGLCGPPLRNSCSNFSAPATLPYLPTSVIFHPPAVDPKNKFGGNKHQRLGKNLVIAIVAGDVIGLSLVGMTFFYYWKAVSCKNGSAGGSGKGHEQHCFCFVGDEQQASAKTVEQFGFIPLDLHVDFDIDKLLKASAYILGKTGIGILYKVVLEDGVTLAVRRLGDGDLQRFKEIRSEIEIIGKLRHPNIVTLRAYYWSLAEKLLIYDFIPNGNLSAAMHGNAETSSFSPMPWLVRLRVAKGIARELVYIHEFSPKKFVHGNFKPSNILLGLDMEPYISDFGLGRLTPASCGLPGMLSNQMSADIHANQTPDVLATLFGNPESIYQAPEAPKLRKPTQKWDVYSFGVILLEILSGRSPILLVGVLEVDIVRWVRLCIEERKPVSEILDPFLARERGKKEEIMAVLKIALACVQTSAERRPPMRHVLEALERLAATS